MKRILLVFFILVSLNANDDKSQTLANGVKQAIKNKNCKLYYSFILKKDRVKQPINDFCRLFHKEINRFDNKNITINEIYNLENDTGILEIMWIDKKTLETDSIDYPIVKENKKWVLKWFNDEYKSIKRMTELENTLFYSVISIADDDYDKKLLLLNEYLNLMKSQNWHLKRGEYYQNKITKTNQKISNILKAQNIDKDLIKVIKPTIFGTEQGYNYVFSTDIQNKTNERFKTLVLKVYLLDEQNNPIYDKGFIISDLKPNYVESITEEIEIPSIWDIKKQNFKIEIKYLEVDSNTN